MCIFDSAMANGIAICWVLLNCVKEIFGCFAPRWSFITASAAAITKEAGVGAVAESVAAATLANVAGNKSSLQINEITFRSNDHHLLILLDLFFFFVTTFFFLLGYIVAAVVGIVFIIFLRNYFLFPKKYIY